MAMTRIKPIIVASPIPSFVLLLVPSCDCGGIDDGVPVAEALTTSVVIDDLNLSGIVLN